MAKKKKIDSEFPLDKIKRNLEDSALILRDSIRGVERVKKNRKEIAKKLQDIDDNVAKVKRLLKVIRDRDAELNSKIKSKPKKNKPALGKKKNEPQFLSDGEYRKLYPKKKVVVYFHKSDFQSIDEYIDYMRRPPISKEEAAGADWDDFGKKLEKWAKK